MRDAIRLIRTVLGATAMVAVSGAVFMAGYLMYRVWTDTGDAAKTVMAPFSWVGETVRVLRGSYRHRIPSQSNVSLDTTAALLAAVAISKDSEGETAHSRQEVMAYIYDAMLRAKARGVSLEENFRKAHTWTPLDWDHDAHVPLLTKLLTGGWVDRDLKKTLRSVPPDILHEAQEIVSTRTEPDPAHCALHIIRPKDHTTTSWSGELEAREAIYKMRPDPVLSKRGYRTKFFCLP